MAWTAEKFWLLAQHLHAHEPLEQERSSDRIFERLQQEQILRLKIEAVSLDSTIVKVHPDGTGALKKQVRSPSESPEAAGRPSFIWLPRMLNVR